MKRGKKFIENCPHCFGELVIKGSMIVAPECFDGLVCKECKRSFVYQWQFAGWKEIDKETLRGITQE